MKEKNIHSIEDLSNDYLKEEEVAKFMGIKIASLRSLYSRRSSKLPPKTKIGKLTLFRKQSFFKWLESREEQVNNDLNAYENCN